MHDHLRDHVIKGKHGRYKLIDIRGSGSMATVYIGRDLNTNRLFAVKVLRSEMAEQQEMASRFEREATILTLLIDPHIVRQLEYGRDGTFHYVVMDYIDGVTLKELILADGPFSIQRALDTAHQIAEGLEAAHKKRVIHRDMKPQNILVSTTNVVKLTDFGMARTLESATITEEGSFLGTPYYVAPEQATDGHSADIRSDLYSLGCIFFEMLTGQVPYESKTALDVILMHLRNPVPSACQLRPTLPRTIDSFLQKAMAKDPSSRFQTPQDFIQ